MFNSKSTSASMAPLRAGKQTGFTLIEMMISITIGLGILAGLVGVLAANSSNFRTNDRSAELMTNGRYALNSMKQELRQAGFLGYTLDGLMAPAALGTLSNECLPTGGTAGAFIANIGQGIWGANDSNPFNGTCIPNASYDNGDVLVVRRLSATPEDLPLTLANKIYFQSSYAVGQVFRGTTVPVFANSPTPLATHAVQIYVYYISPFTVSASESPRVPALYRVALGNNGAMARELVASGIEHMQIQYGVLTPGPPPTTRFFDTLAGSSTDTSTTEWSDVNAVRIWLLARNETAEPGYANTQVYTMGDQTYTASDGFRRQLFSTVVQLRN